jgi:ABC-2 type transport system permease protein
MTLVLVHARALTVELLRYPAYVVPTIALPSLFFLFFGASAGDGAGVRMAGFAGFAAIGVAFFQFGVGIAAERASAWEQYLRTLAAPARVRLAARWLSAAAFAAGASGLVIALAVAIDGVSLAATAWLGVGFALVAGTVPFALLGTALGYWVPARAALPLANLLYLTLSYAGGLWAEPHRLPRGVAVASPFLPTRLLADVVAAPVTGSGVPWPAWGGLGAFAAAFAALAAAGYRRDEGRRYR